MADAQCKVELAMVSLRHDVRECGAIAAQHVAAPRSARARWGANSALQAQFLLDAMTNLRYRDGFNGAFLHQTLQRAARDVATGTAHVGTDWDLMGGRYGRILLGVDQPTDPLAV